MFGVLRARAIGITLSIVVGSSSVAIPARADAPEPADAKNVEDARWMFSQGSAHYSAHRYKEALDSLVSSYRLVPSPNSGLLVARCLRELGRAPEAVEWYAKVEQDARKRVSDGDAKYTQTADAAATEGAALRAGLGTLRIRVKDPAPGTRLEVDQQPVAIPASGEVVMWHAPGDVTVRVQPPSGPAQGQVATVQARGEARMVFEGGAHAGKPAPDGDQHPPPLDGHGAPPSSGSSDGTEWTKPAALVAGGVAVVGLGVALGFGLSSRAIYNDLATRCGPDKCASAADRADANRGQSQQTIANVGLVIGVTAAVAAVSFLVIGLTGHKQVTLGSSSRWATTTPTAIAF